MDDKLIPAHLLFAKWFIRIRWIATGVLILATFIINNLVGINIEEKPIYIMAIILLFLNFLHTAFLRIIHNRAGRRIIIKIKNEIHFQIVSDLIVLALIIHYSGGIENPLVLFFFFHMIIASSIYSTIRSYMVAGFALALLGLIAFLECYSVIPHYHLVGFMEPTLYQNTLFLYSTGFIFSIASIMVVSLSHMIIYRSIKSEALYSQKNLELENKDRLKNEYVLRVTHDIKGHLASILSCLEVIRQKITGPLNETQEEFVNRAYDRTISLSDFVRNLLNLTRKRLRQDQDFNEYSMKELVEKAITNISASAADKSITLNYYIDNQVDTIIGNPITIEELFNNLLTNALKYTPSGGMVELRINKHDKKIMIEVSDNGLGIPKEEQENVFDEFYRASNVPKDIKSGSGLGLSIVKQIVENHKGSIKVESEPGIWTRFTIILPLNASEVVSYY